MAFTFSYNDYFKNNANAQIPSSSTVPTTSSTVPTTPVLYSQFVSPPTYTPPSLTPTPAPNPTPTPTPTPSTGYGAVTGQYGATTTTSAGKGTGGSTITYSSGAYDTSTGAYDTSTGSGSTTIGGGSGGGDGNGDGKSNGNNDDLPKYYELLYNTGLANAEQAKQQALLNAQTQYKEFINPYGTVANQQAALGLQNGGYSEYLQGQAYQGMLNTQNQARSDYAKTQQSLYSDYMGNMAKYNQAQQDKADAAAAAKAELLNNIGNYTSEEALGAALDALGITDAAERQSIIDQWKTAKAEKDAQVQGDNNLTMQAIIDGTADVEPTEENIQAVGTKLGLSQEEIESWKEKLRNKQYAENINPNGDWSADDWEKFFIDARYETLSPEQKEEADAEYSALIARTFGYDPNTGATTSYFVGDDGVNNITDKNAAKQRYEEAQADEHFSPELKEAIKKEYEAKYLGGRTVEYVDLLNKARELNPDINISEDANIVDTKSNTYQITDFGVFNDSGTGKGEQDTYLNALLSDLDSHIVAGDLVWVNYGKYDMGAQNLYMYIGDGKFVAVNGTVNAQNIDKIKLPSNGEYEINKNYTSLFKFGRVTKKKK